MCIKNCHIIIYYLLIIIIIIRELVGHDLCGASFAWNPCSPPFAVASAVLGVSFFDFFSWWQVSVIFAGERCAA